MTESRSWNDIIQQLRRGDAEAAAALVREYEPLIRRIVRLRLEDNRLRRVFDSMDVCQSVLGSFFLRASVGEYDLQDSSQLVKLLVSMTRNKVASAARREYRGKRDARRAIATDTQQLEAIQDAQETPSQIVMGNELLDRARGLMCSDELKISELRTSGFSWEQIAMELGGTAQARRVQFMRTMQRITQHLGLEEEST